MKPDRWQEIDNLLQATLAERPSQRILFLSKACKSDEPLRLEVESLLAAHEEAGDFLEQSVSGTAANLLITGQRESVIGQTVGSYRIVKSLGAGGMGEVYLADDQKLGRKVALKMLPDYLIDDQSRRRRFTQEARSASSLNHPNIVTIYEIGEADGHHFIATEFIEGETLRQHMLRTRSSIEEVLEIALQLASALAAAHKRGVVHRDIKPENIMIRPDGYVKILDFGLAKLTENPFGEGSRELATEAISAIDSIPGIILGTVTYMSPEQARGLPVDARTDVWSLGVVLYEMLTAKAPFCGETPADVIVSILEKEPPHFDQASVPFMLNRIINKTLRKNRERRYQTAHELVLNLKIVKEELNAQPRRESFAGPPLVASLHDPSIALRPDTAKTISARRVRRIVVLPFRMLRPDADLDFLAFSLPDAVAGALSVLDSVVVSAPTAPGHVHDELDLNQLAKESHAELALTGTILRVGEGIRVTCKLLEIPNGTVLWWHEPHVSMSDLFELQDNLVGGIVDSLSLSLSVGEHGRLKRDVPASAIAYELYLRGNELSRRGLAGFNNLTLARDLYLQSVEADPDYAPAWSQLGRCYRLIGKGMENGRANLASAESAFRRALDLNSELPIANSQYAFLEAELGRAPDAVARLLRCVSNGNASPDLFVALVLCCRFSGLLSASVAAHECARKLDPLVATSVSHTHYQLAHYESALRDVAVGAWGIQGMTLGTMARTAEALAALRKLEDSGIPGPMQAFVIAWRAMFEGDYKQSLEAAERCVKDYLDPEGVFYMGLIMAHLGESDRALTVLNEAIDRGFSSFDVLKRNPWFDSLRSKSEFTELLNRARERLVEADEIYLGCGGPSVLGDSSLDSLAAKTIRDGRDGEPLRKAGTESSTTLTSHESLTSRSLAAAPNAGRSNPFVGRETDVTRLEDLLRKASGGSGRLVFITGETGIGKTTLADEFMQRSGQRYPALFLARGRCLEQYGTGEAYLPFLDALSGLLTGPGWEHIAAIFRTYAPTWCLQLPTTFVSGKDLERLQYETIGATKRRMLREMGDALRSLTAKAPLLLVLEDLHWADPSSTDLLQYLSQRVSDRRLLIVGTFRPEDVALGNHPLKKYKLEMEAHSLCDEIPLTSFNNVHIASYLNKRFDNNNFPNELAALIQRKTEGHPLFATSLVQFLVDREDITKTEDKWSLGRPLAALEMVAPENVRSMILKKIESVTEDDKRILQYASIEGEQFTSTVVANLIAADDVSVEERLDRLDKIHRLIDTRGEERLPDGTLTVRYRFAHALYQNLLYETLIPRRRRLLHLQAGEQLTARYGNESSGIATQLAMHFERGGDLSRAIQYLMQAGDNAIKLYANAEAERHYSHAILLVEKLPAREQLSLQLDLYHKRGKANLALTQLKEAEDDFSRMRVVARAGGATPSECVALNALADTFFYSHRLKEMRASAAEALQVAEQLDDKASQIEAMVGLGMTYTGSGELAEGKRLLDAGILAARNHAPSTALIRGLTYRGILHYFQTEYAAAEELLTEAVSLASELRNGFMLLHSRFFLGLNFGNQGRISDALSSLRETMEMAQRDGDHIVLARVPNSIGWIHRELGDLDEAIALDKQSSDIARDRHVTEAEANSLINLSHDYTVRHNGESSLVALNDAKAVFEREQWNHWRFHHIRFHAGAAEHYLSQENYDQAREHANTLLENATHYEVPKYMAIAHKLIAEILCAGGQLVNAEIQFCEGLSKLETHPAPLLTWRINGQLGELRLQLGDRVGAREALSRSADIINKIASEITDEALRLVFLNSSSVRAVLAGIDT